MDGFKYVGGPLDTDGHPLETGVSYAVKVTHGVNSPTFRAICIMLYGEFFLVFIDREFEMENPVEFVGAEEHVEFSRKKGNWIENS